MNGSGKNASIVAATIHFVHKYIEPVHRFLKAIKKQKQGNIKV
jgi:hypothetical protein